MKKVAKLAMGAGLAPSDCYVIGDHSSCSVSATGRSPGLVPHQDVVRPYAAKFSRVKKDSSSARAWAISKRSNGSRW